MGSFKHIPNLYHIIDLLDNLFAIRELLVRVSIKVLIANEGLYHESDCSFFASSLYCLAHFIEGIGRTGSTYRYSFSALTVQTP